jgi:hypothetical protein
MIGRAMMDARVTELDALPEPARTLALDVRHFAATHADNFSAARFDAWALDVARGDRSPIDGTRTPGRVTA